MHSMTGYGHRVASIDSLGKAVIELRSANHKYLEIAFHLPPGYLAVEEKIKKEIESKVKRGRLTCVLNMVGPQSAHAGINKPLLKRYLALIGGIRREFGIEESVGMNALLQLPGVLIHEESLPLRADIWPKLRPIITRAVADLVAARAREGKALAVFLAKRAVLLDRELSAVKERFHKACTARLAGMKTDDERASFLKTTDVTEELERLAYHIKSFQSTLMKAGPVGKELDFIAQEMQREVNTLAAKTFDTAISGRVVQMKSQIEKIREQVPNVE